jgi:hypothetical protein
MGDEAMVNESSGEYDSVILSTHMAVGVVLGFNRICLAARNSRLEFSV